MLVVVAVAVAGAMGVALTVRVLREMLICRGNLQARDYMGPSCPPSACDKKHRALGILEHPFSDLAEGQSLAGTAAHSHDDEILSAAARLLENRLGGARVLSDCGAHAHVVLIRDPHDVLQHRLLLAPPGTRESERHGTA